MKRPKLFLAWTRGRAECAGFFRAPAAVERLRVALQAHGFEIAVEHLSADDPAHVFDEDLAAAMKSDLFIGLHTSDAVAPASFRSLCNVYRLATGRAPLVFIHKAASISLLDPIDVIVIDEWYVDVSARVALEYVKQRVEPEFRVAANGAVMAAVGLFALETCVDTDTEVAEEA